MSQATHNDKIHICDIFMYSSSDESGSYCAFYQVEEVRGKTLVELRGIRAGISRMV